MIRLSVLLTLFLAAQPVHAQSPFLGALQDCMAAVLSRSDAELRTRGKVAELGENVVVVDYFDAAQTPIFAVRVDTPQSEKPWVCQSATGALAPVLAGYISDLRDPTEAWFDAQGMVQLDLPTPTLSAAADCSTTPPTVAIVYATPEHRVGFGVSAMQDVAPACAPS